MICININKELEKLCDDLGLKAKEYEAMINEYAAQHDMPEEFKLRLTVEIVEKNNPENVYFTIGVKNNDEIFTAPISFLGYA